MNSNVFDRELLKKSTLEVLIGAQSWSNKFNATKLDNNMHMN